MPGSRKRVFNGRLLKIYTDKKRLPDGRTAYFEEVEHPGAALVVPFSQKKIVFIRQYRAVIGKYIWELPAGTLFKGETPYACAKREVAEETGYIVKNLKKIGAIYTSPGFCNEKIIVFKADCVGKGNINRDADEIINLRLFDSKRVKDLFTNGRIVDSKTISALSFAGVL